MSAVTARDEVLARVRAALAVPGSHHARTDGPEPTGGLAPPTGRTEILDLFEERVVDYRASFERTARADLDTAVAAALTSRSVASVVVPQGLPESLTEAIAEAGVTVVTEETVQSDGRPGPAALDALDGVVTTSSVGIATTGTIILDHSSGQGARALTLVPDLHVCIVDADAVVTGVPEAVARLRASVVAGRPLTWVSGPSATSDIELERVEGVHGPRTLHVVLVVD
ncbi:MAG: LUD domain-containing protein [Terracoccus sp.]